MNMIIDGLQYSKDHEWVDSDGSVPALIGISAIAAEALGDIVFVELPDVGATVTAGEVCGEVESTKSVSELYSPVSGEIVETNMKLVDHPELINTDPYGAGWLFTVTVTAEGPLLSPQEYAELAGIER